MVKVPKPVDPAGRELWPGPQEPECTPYRETFLAQLEPTDRVTLRKAGRLIGTAVVCYDGPYCDEDYVGALRASARELYHVADYLGRYLGGELEAHSLEDDQVYECLLGGIFADKTIELGNHLVRAIAELRRRREAGRLMPIARDGGRDDHSLDQGAVVADLKELVEATGSGR